MRESLPLSPTPPASAWEQYAPIAASLVVHLSLIGILAVIVLPERDSSPVTAISTTVAREHQAELVTLEDALARAGDERPSAQTSAAQESFLPQPGREEVDSTPRTDLALPLDLHHSGPSAGTMAQRVAPLRSTAGAAGESGADSGDGSGKGGERMFGLNINAGKIVFVVDNSRSMNYPHPGPLKTRLGRVKFELLHTVAELTPEQRFFIIFFNTNAVPMPADRLVEATPGAKRLYLEWVSRLKAEGTTEPEAALLMALRLRPDEIYFLTDGAIRYKVVPNVTEANPTGITIHTICFGDDRGEPFLKEMADRNNGTYKFVPDGEVPGTTPAKPAGGGTATSAKTGPAVSN